MMKTLAYVSLTCLPLLVFSGSSAAVDDPWTQPELERVTARIQEQVETIREELFTRPVKVAIADQEGFFLHATRRLTTLFSPEELAAEESAAKLLGLIPPGMDLLEVTFEVLEDQVGGFYDPSQETFYLMDTFTGGIAKVILSHELTHALDDQLFDIDGTLEGLIENRDAAAAFQAVVEGSGTAVMALWTLKYGRTLDPAELQAAATMGADSLNDAPPYIWKPLLGSYVRGQVFLNQGYKRGKKEGLSFSDVTRRAFESPPLSTEQVLHPDKYWVEEERDDPRVIHVEAKLPGEWKILDRSTLGELTLSLLTEEERGIDFTDLLSIQLISYTNPSTEGWGGDTMILFGKGDSRFLHVVTLWDTPEDADEFRSALKERKGWGAEFGVLDPGGAGCGVSVLDAGEDRSVVRFSAWHGVGDAEAQEIVEGIRYQEVERK